jgi:hypothetical protein
LSDIVLPVSDGVEPASTAAAGDGIDMRPLAAKPGPRPRPAAPKWEEAARTRIKASLKHLSKPLTDALNRDANEADTRLLITELLCEALGYHRFEDLDTEYAVKGQFADYGLRIDKQLVAFVEVKRSATKLTTKHLRQVEMYAVNEGVEWIILTNSNVWQVYHLQGGLPVVVDLVFEVNLLTELSGAVLSTALLPITREGIKHGLLDSLWKQARATSPQSIASAIMAPTVLKAIRSEMHRQTGHILPIDDVAQLVKDTVLKPDCFS